MGGFEPSTYCLEINALSLRTFRHRSTKTVKTLSFLSLISSLYAADNRHVSLRLRVPTSISNPGARGRPDTISRRIS
jgi:hypothetical protein